MNIEERIYKEQGELLKIIDKALAYAQKNGVTQAAASVSKRTGLKVKVRNQEVEKVSFSKGRSLSIEVYTNRCSGSSYTRDLSEDAIISTVDAAIAISRHTTRDEYAGLPEEKDMQDQNVDLDQFHPQEPDADKMANDALSLEKMSLAHPQIKQSYGASFVNSYGQLIIGNTYGTRLCKPFSSFSESINLIAEKDGKMENDGAGHSAVDFADLWSMEKLSSCAIERTISRLGPRKLQTMTCPVIFDKRAAPTLLSFLLDGLNGRSQFQKTTFIKDCLGTKLFPDWINIEENPYIPKKIFSSCFDMDGARTTRKFIINGGVCESYILDAYSARQLKMQNTGNAGMVSNVIVSNSGITKEQLLKQMGKGLIVTELMGSGFDEITGKLSVGACGFWVENGEIQYPVNEITIAGDVKELFQNIVAIDDDFDPRSSVKVGNILIDHMKIAGK